MSIPRISSFLSITEVTRKWKVSLDFPQVFSGFCVQDPPGGKFNLEQRSLMLLKLFKYSGSSHTRILNIRIQLIGFYLPFYIPLYYTTSYSNIYIQSFIKN